MAATGASTLSPDPELAANIPSWLATRKGGLTVTKKHVRSLLRFIGVGLMVAAAVVLVSKPQTNVGDDPNQRVAAHAFATNSGQNFRSFPEEYEPFVFSMTH